MIRFLLRSIGYLIVAGGFVLLVLDGARSVANQSLLTTPAGESLARLLGDRFALLQPAVERNLHPFLWDPVLTRLLAAPSFALALALGFIFLWLGRRPEPGVGVLTRA